MNKYPRRYISNEFQDCSICGTPNEVAVTASGGRFERITEHVVVGPSGARLGEDTLPMGLWPTRQVPAAAQATQGCMFCTSPAWRTGGKRGDL